MNGMVASAVHASLHEPSSAALAEGWRGTVQGWCRVIDWDDLTNEMHDERHAFMAAVKRGDALVVGEFVLQAHRRLAERLARKWGDEWVDCA